MMFGIFYFEQRVCVLSSNLLGYVSWLLFKYIFSRIIFFGINATWPQLSKIGTIDSRTMVLESVSFPPRGLLWLSAIPTLVNNSLGLSFVLENCI